MVPLVVMAALVVLAIVTIGCQRATGPARGSTGTGAHETHHAGLRAEYARLEAEQATPQLLQAATQTADPDGALAQQLRAALSQILDPDALRGLLDRLAPLYPDGDLDLRAAAGPTGQGIAADYAEHLAQYRELLERADLRLLVDFLGGFLADLSFLDHATAAHRLEALQAADALQNNRPRDAASALSGMFRITAALNEPKLLAARLTAAQLRGESLQIVAATARHPQADRDLHQRLCRLLNEQLADWPPDADAWIGDRALGMQTYEMVRGGQLLNLLTSQEIETLRGREDQSSWTRRIMKSLDDDEAFYLDTMRTLIESCQEPYPARVPILTECAVRLDRLHDTPRYPLIAAQVLLGNVATAMRRQVADRARCEAWRLALAAATSDAPQPPPVNPLTDTPFALVVSATRVDVRADDARDAALSVSVPVREEAGRPDADTDG